MSSSGNSKHDELVSSVVERLKQKGYKTIETNIEYHEGQFNGEFDILTYRNGFWNYYEIKSSYSTTNRKCAERQTQRAAKAYPRRKWRFIFVTPTKVERL